MKKNELSVALLALVMAMGAGYGCGSDAEDDPGANGPGAGGDEDAVDLGPIFFRMKVDGELYEYSSESPSRGRIGSSSYTSNACGEGVHAYNIGAGFFADPKATQGTLDLTLSWKRCLDAAPADRCVLTEWLEEPRTYQLEVNPSTDKFDLNLGWTDPDAEPGTFASYHGQGQLVVTSSTRKGPFIILEGTVDGSFRQTSGTTPARSITEGEFRLYTLGCDDADEGSGDGSED